METILITGGAGFFGGILKEKLLEYGYSCVSIDLHKDSLFHPNLISVQGDIRDSQTLEKLFSQYRFGAIFHCAAILAHSARDKKFLWSCNVGGTRNIAEFAGKFKVPRVIFTSSNCLWGENLHRLVTEEDVPKPVEIYGKSKLEGERILLSYKEAFDTVIFRCPTIMDRGRLGLLSILFEFVDEGRKVWVVGGGNNRYQFVYAQDLVDACLRALRYDETDIFNVGSDDVKTLKEVYDYVIQKAGTGARVASLPRRLAIPAMRIAYILGLSPLGPYQYKMIAEDFIFDTSKIKQKLGWQPTMDNGEMLWKAYEDYRNNKKEIYGRRGVSAHRQAAKAGIIKLLKWVS